MTPEERRNPNIIGGSRRHRIAQRSGVKPQDVNQLLNQFQQMQRLMKLGVGGKLPKNLTGIFKQSFIQGNPSVFGCGWGGAICVVL